MRRRGRRAPTSDPIGLFGKQNGETLGEGGLTSCDEVGRLHASASAVAEDECSARILRGVHVGTCGPMRCVDLDDFHVGDCADRIAGAGHLTPRRTLSVDGHVLPFG